MSDFDAFVIVPFQGELRSVSGEWFGCLCDSYTPSDGFGVRIK